MSDNQTTRNGHKLVPMKQETRLVYLLHLEREHALSGLLAELGYDAATLHDSKNARLKLFQETLGEPVCEEGYPLQIDMQALFEKSSSPAVLTTLHVVEPEVVIRRLTRRGSRTATEAETRQAQMELRQAGIAKKGMS